MADEAMPIEVFIKIGGAVRAPRVPGTAVFMTSTPDGVPHALLHNLKHNKVLHERVVILTVHDRATCPMPAAERVARRRSSGTASG